FRPSRTPTFDFGAPALDASSATHTLSGDTDSYALATTAALPPRVAGLVYSLSGPARFRGVPGDGCQVSEGASTLTCPTVQDGDRVILPLAATGLTGTTAVTVTADPRDAFSDPTPGDHTASLDLAPGAELGLDLSVFSANPDRNGLVVLTGRLSGVRTGLTHVVYTVSSGATFAVSGNPSCRPDGATMTCLNATEGQVALTLRADDRNLATSVTVSVAPVVPFEAVGTGHAVRVILPGRALHDFSWTGLHETAHTLQSGDTDRYTVTGTLGDLPAGTTSVDLTLTDGGSFAPDQPDPHCALPTSPATGSEVHCTGVTAGGEVALDVLSTVPSTHAATVVLQPTEPFDDPDLTNNQQTVSGLRPGTDLVLDPAALGSLHQGAGGTYALSLTVRGVRSGVESVGLALSHGLAFVVTSTPGCAVTGAGLTCTGLASGDRVAGTVTSATPTRATALTLSATPGGDFVDLGAGHDATATLVPSYGFALGDLRQTGHTLTGDTDHYTLSSALPALPAGLDALTFELTGGGGFAADQATDCTRTDLSRVRCTGLADRGDVSFRVDSASTAAHVAGIRLVVPDGYDDPDASDNARTVALTPGVDLRLGALTPADPVPGSGGAYQVEGVLRGVRSGPVTFTVSGAATVTDSTCTLTGQTSVSCAHPRDGQSVGFTLRPTKAADRTAVSVRADASPPLVELAPENNTATAILAPDVTLDSVVVRGHRTGQALVRAQVSGVPPGVGTVRIRLSGTGVGTDPGQVHLTDGVDGADGQGVVGCYTSDATGRAVTDGTYATCTAVASAPSGGFYIDMRVARPTGASTRVTFTVLPVGVDEGAHGQNNSRDLTIG
ncbi:MAG: hypothetical protein ABI776_01025, partial [Nocardioidaceae bacterium]